MVIIPWSTLQLPFQLLEEPSWLMQYMVGRTRRSQAGMLLETMRNFSSTTASHSNSWCLISEQVRSLKILSLTQANNNTRTRPALSTKSKSRQEEVQIRAIKEVHMETVETSQINSAPPTRIRTNNRLVHSLKARCHRPRAQFQTSSYLIRAMEASLL